MGYELLRRERGVSMTDKYDLIFDEFKKFIEENSQYGARVVKYNTNTSSYFPLITCIYDEIHHMHIH